MSKKERTGKVLYALDLGFSDFFKDENVGQLTIEEGLDVIEKAVDFVHLEEAMNFSVFSSRGPNHPVAEIYSIDFPSDLRASIYLLLGGYYRQAILCLRNWLEIRLTGIYFGFVQHDRVEYEEWKQGKREGPFGRVLIARLFERSEFQKADKSLGLRNRLGALYGELSAFTHGAVLGRYDLQSCTDNVPRFNPQSLELWHEFAKRAFAEIAICFLLGLGSDAFCAMDRKEMETLYRLLPGPYQQELHRRSSKGA